VGYDALTVQPCAAAVLAALRGELRLLCMLRTPSVPRPPFWLCGLCVLCALAGAGARHAPIAAMAKTPVTYLADLDFTRYLSFCHHLPDLELLGQA
jgi:hypothetical protein